jgi:predicted DNA-binding protein with PD1-like motif
MRRMGFVLGWLLMVMSAEAGTGMKSKGVFHVFRLKPGSDLIQEIRAWAKSNRIRAASVVTTVGSLKRLNLRYANQSDGVAQEGKYEITSLVGTIADSGLHLHLQVSDTKGNSIGGHLLEGNLIFTTAEIVLVEFPELSFSREPDEASGYHELVIRK